MLMICWTSPSLKNIWMTPNNFSIWTENVEFKISRHAAPLIFLRSYFKGSNQICPRNTNNNCNY